MSSLLAADVAASALPIISIAGLRSPDPQARAAVASQIRAACCDKGFFYVTGHGVPDALMDAMLTEARRFFALPLERKMAIDVSRSSCYRGYEPMRRQTLEAGAPPDVKESFSIDRDLPLDDPWVLAQTFGCGPNLWPAGLPGWRETIEAYQREMNALSEVMVRGLALSLGVAEDAFAGFCDEASGIVRLVHYPPQPANPLPDEKGCGAHTDWGAFTFLLQDDAGGLQVWDQRAGWINATPIPGTFVVNIGDMMARWTNDLYHSTRHRVVNVSGRDRISIPFFYMGRLDYDVVCVPSCLADGASPTYPPTTPARHLEAMARLTFGG